MRPEVKKVATHSDKRTLCEHYDKVNGTEDCRKYDDNLDAITPNCATCHDYYEAYVDFYRDAEGITGNYNNAKGEYEGMRTSLQSEGMNPDLLLSKADKINCNQPKSSEDGIVCSLLKRKSAFDTAEAAYKGAYEKIRGCTKEGKTENGETYYCTQNKDIIDAINTENTTLQKFLNIDEPDIETANSNFKVTDLLNCSDYQGSKHTQKDCNHALMRFAYIINCINIADVSDVTKRQSCPGLRTSMCMKDGKRDSGKSCLREVYIPGAFSADDFNYYASMRQIAKSQVAGYYEEAYGKTIVSENDADFKTAVDDYVIDQINRIFDNTSKDMRDNLIAVKQAYGYYKAGKLSDDSFASTVFENLSTFLTQVYSGVSYFPSKDKLNQAIAQLHRTFFAWITVGGMTDVDKAALYRNTFSVRLECVDQNTPIGDTSGMKKYCITREGLRYSLADILGAMQVDDSAIVKMADAMLMDYELNLPIGSGKDSVTVNTKVSTIVENYDGEAHPLKGDWLIMHCPSGGSCNPANQCGACSNGDINANGQICVKGSWQAQTSSQAQSSSKQ